MLIPRFSFRFLLLVVTAFAFVFFVISLAIQGRQWAIAASVALVGLAATMLIQAGTFGVAWGVTSLLGLFRSKQLTASPFAASRPPPQVIEPPTTEE